MKPLHSTLALLALFAVSSSAQLPELPQPATSFGAALADGWLYIYGGNTGKAHEFNRDCVKGDFFRLKLPDGTAWEKLPGGTALLSSSLVAHDGKIIRIGGMNARNAKGEKNDLHSTAEVMRFDPATQKWDALPALPEARSSHDAVVVGDTLYVGGGWRLAGDDGDGAAATWEKTLLSLDLKTPGQGWQKKAQPFERRAIAAVADGKRLWFFGGMDSHNKPSRAVDWCDLATGEWGHGPDLPEGAMAGFGVSGCLGDGRVLASPLSGKIFALGDGGGTWNEIARLATARFFHRLLPMADGRLIAVGGSNKQGHVCALEIVSLNSQAGPSALTPSQNPTPSIP